MRYPRMSVAICVGVLAGSAAARAEERTFDQGSLIIPMDLTYQDRGMFQAYGLLFQLLRQGVKVAWVIDPDKTWHHADCDTVGDLCAWDCEIEGQGSKCPYPTASPDFFVAAEVVWDGEGTRPAGTAIANHGYRGGPFVIAAADRDAALAIIDVWNDQSAWAANAWAQRTIFNVVSVHEATASFVGFVVKDMLAAPTIAVFSDGNEDIATSYLRAAGIPQSSGAEFPAAKCGAAGTCGPGTPNPDMLTVPSVAGDMGTCSNPSSDHENGALFTADGLPAYCQIMSMHWAVTDRETVQCGGGGCPATQAACAPDVPITYHGHEVVAEVRSFLSYPVHFFAECQAVNAYENTVPNPAWPFLDDDGRIGHFLTTTGMPPACPCTDADFECVIGGCGGADCCLPRDVKEQGAGFLIAAAPADIDVKVLRPNVAYNQLDGRFSTIGGSEPAYNLSAYLMTEYINDREVTFLTGPLGPGDQDVWMTGYADGECDIGGGDDVGGPAGECAGGKVSYLGGHDYAPAVPLSSHTGTQGTRLFLNALFEADCVTAAGQPLFDLSLVGELVVGAQSLPVERPYQVGYVNLAPGPALDSILDIAVPAVIEVADAPGGTIAAPGANWQVGSISGDPAQIGDPPSAGSRPATLRFTTLGDHQVTVGIDYRVGTSRFTARRTFNIHVGLDSDGDGVPDDTDPFPLDPNRCGDTDDDTCDDCSQGMGSDPANDGTDTDGDGICDAGEGGGGGGDGDGTGCGCRAAPGRGSLAGLLAAVAVALVVITRRRRS